MIISRTPFRISFVGGGTDLRDFYSIKPGVVISACIDKYMYLCVNKRFDHTIRLSYSKTEIVDSVDKIQHPIVREVLKLTGIKEGIEISSIADIPAGTGLGSSGSFTVGLLHALYAYKGIYVTAERLANEASYIEIDVLKEPIGKQDQYITAFGGLQHIRFNPDESVYVDPVLCSREAKTKLNENLLMFYTGITRKSSSILSQQKKKTTKNMQYLMEMSCLPIKAKDILMNGKCLDDFGKVMHEGWLFKKKLTNNISNERIDKYYQTALDSGAIGGKILGAGGGGFLLLYVKKSIQERVRRSLKQLREITFNFEPEGSKIIYVGVSSW